MKTEWLQIKTLCTAQYKNIILYSLLFQKSQFQWHNRFFLVLLELKTEDPEFSENKIHFIIVYIFRSYLTYVNNIFEIFQWRSTHIRGAAFCYLTYTKESFISPCAHDRLYQTPLRECEGVLLYLPFVRFFQFPLHS